MIPRILHQTWKTNVVPDRFVEFQQSWRRHHPAWEYRLWSDAENQDLIEQEYPQFAEFYRRLPYPILRVEFVKLAYLHRFGGLYVDLDFEALRPIEPLLDKQSIVVGRETGGMGHWLRGRDYILNALIGSTAGHSLWLDLMQQVVARFRPKKQWQIYEVYVLRSVIEIMDDLIEERRRQADDIIVYSHRVLYPSSQAERSIAGRRNLAAHYGSFAIHHYDDSWFSPSLKLLTTLRYGWLRAWRSCFAAPLDATLQESNSPPRAEAEYDMSFGSVSSQS